MTDPNESGSSAVDDANQRAGLWLFLVYCLAYFGFVFANALFPANMSEIPFPDNTKLHPWLPSLRGINWAVLSGLCLIVFAVLLAFVYSVICGRNSRKYRKAVEQGHSA